MSEESAHEAAGDQRLDSWKEIANYLNRTVRTVQRWEQEQGLPIHRRSLSKRDSVFAFKSELDDWLAQTQAAAGRSGTSVSSPYRRVAAAGVCIAVVLVALWWGFFRGASDNDVSHTPDPVTVLVTQFENRTGDPIFDGTLEYALEQGIVNSGFLRVASEVRIEDTLRLMRKSPGSPVDRELGREICLRDGFIDTLLTGRIEQLGSIYRLGVNIVEAESNITLAAHTWEAESQAQILPGIRELSDWVGSELADKLLQEKPSSGPSRAEGSGQIKARDVSEKVTTPTLRAWSLYVQGRRAYSQEMSKEKAEILLRQAIEEDPGFASAHLLLAWTLRSQGRQQEAMSYMNRAKDLAETTSQAERAFILGCYHHWRGEHEQAVTHYEILLDLQPDHPWGYNNLVSVLNALGKSDQVKRRFIQQAQTQPGSMSKQVNLAVFLVNRGDKEEAMPFVRRAQRLLAQDPDLYLREYGRAGWVACYEIWEKWLDGDLAGAVAEAERVRKLFLRQEAWGGWTDRNAGYLARSYLTLGMVERAESFFDGLGAEEWVFQTLLAFVKGNTKPLKPYTKGKFRNVAIPMVVLRLDPQAPQWVQELDFGFRSDSLVSNKLQAELALSRGHYSEAVRLYREVTNEVLSRTKRRPLRIPDDPSTYLAFLGLAEAWVGLGNMPEAIQVLELDSESKKATFGWTAPLWLTARDRLAQLYRQAGREEEAREIDDELRRLLAYADPDHPILLRLEELDPT